MILVLNIISLIYPYKKKWSYKLKSAGIRTQVLIDINEMAINVSNSQLCGNSSDGGMFLDMKIYNKILLH